MFIQTKLYKQRIIVLLLKYITLLCRIVSTEFRRKILLFQRAIKYNMKQLSSETILSEMHTANERFYGCELIIKFSF